ncbi:MAG: glycosyltransferase [Candidatus Promineifilaceae bacterium]
MVNMRVSVIATVMNEGESIRRLMDSLAAQSRLPDEVVIADGGSTDSTVEILEQYIDQLPLMIVISPGSNISQGRNAAIKTASGPLIAVTDAGVALDQKWLEELIRPYDERGALMVGGWFEADAYSEFEIAMGATVLPSVQEIDPDRFLPSSRSVSFKKSDWETVGGYPEWLDFSEDLVFDRALYALNGPFHFAPKAVVYFRPRSDIRVFAKQYYFYARGDGRANLWPKRYAVRYATYLLLLPLLLRFIWLGKWFGWAGLAIGAGAYCSRPAKRLFPMTQGWSPTARLRVFSLIPIIRLVGDIAKMIGYPVGVFWRLSRRR